MSFGTSLQGKITNNYRVSGLLGYTKYAPANTIYSTTSTTVTAVDGTNLTVTFTAPASGSVLVRLSAYGDISTNAQQYSWGLLDGANALVSAVSVGPMRNADGMMLSGDMFITGLTAGTSYTYKWAHAVTGGATGRVYAGPGLTATTYTTAMFMPANMEVWDASTSAMTPIVNADLLGFPNLTLPPVTSSWTWRNQGSATLTQNPSGSISVYAPASGNVADIVGIDVAIPALPYTITALLLPTAQLGKEWHAVGLYWTDGTGAVVFIAGATNVGTSGFRVSKWTNFTLFSADYSGGTTTPITTPLWMRVHEDSTNRICSWSGDGLNFSQFHSVGHTDFLTPTRVGMILCRQNAATPNLDIACTLASWKVS